MRISIYSMQKKIRVDVNGSSRGFNSEEAALQYLESIIRETQSAVDSARETYFAMKGTAV